MISSQKSEQTWKWGLDEENSIRAASNEKRPARLMEMAGDVVSGEVSDDGTITSELLFNPRMPLDDAFLLAKHWRDSKGVHDFSWQLSMRRDATPQMLNWCSESHDDITLETLARHPATSIEILVRMARSENWLAVREACSSGRVPTEVINEIADHKEDIFRITAARFAKDPKICRRLALDSSADIRAAAIGNPHTEMSVIDEVALRETDQDVLVAVANRLTEPDLLLAIAKKIKNYHRGLIDAILNNPHSSDHAKIVATV